MKQKKVLVVLIVLSILALTVFPASGCAPKEKPLNVILVWHNHQPFYENPLKKEFILPWVRLHAVKDYWRMPYIVSKYPDVKVTFDLSGSLIQQLLDYQNGEKDIREALSEIPASNLTDSEKWEILQIPGGFFDINWDHIVKKVPLYAKLLNKRNEAFKKFGNPLNKKSIVNYLSGQDYTNLIALFNLFWMDSEYVKNDSALKPLYEKAENSEDFTQADVQLILNKQNELMQDAFSWYKNLLKNSQAEVVTTPYSHPISALLTDFGWDDDLTMQIEAANDLFYKVFSERPNGAWASECALNDQALKIFKENGWNWTISDASNLSQLGVDTKKDPAAQYLPYNVDGVTVFFRAKYLSDGIGFRYSGKSVEDAVSDVKTTLLNVEKMNTSGKLVYTIALDGENAWEYYPNDGNDFLNAFYKTLTELEKEGKIRLITPTEYMNEFGKGKSVSPHNVSVLDLKGKDISLVKSYNGLPKKTITGEFGESSWVNPTLDTWIGEKQENVAWMWLKDARNAFLSKQSSLSHDTLVKANNVLMRAEGSDWFWWYGSDQDSGNDPSFDRLFKLYLMNLYELIGENPPLYLYGNYFPDGTPYSYKMIYFSKDKMPELSLLKNVDVSIKSFSESEESGKFLVNFAAKGLKNLYIFWGDTDAIMPAFTTEGPKILMNPFPYNSYTIGIPVSGHYAATQIGTNSTVSLTGVFPNNSWVVAATKIGNTFEVLTPPMQFKFPVKLTGKVVGELLDDAYDDNGPGSYQYPLADVFKSAGKGLFDLVHFKMLDSGENYILQYKFSNLGGNPWNGPNGFSFQIVETYIDFKDGGRDEPIDPKGPRVALSSKHLWDIALRIAGWSYGNFIELSDGTVVQGELQIQTDQNSNTITVVLPKKYISINNAYKPYIAIISGSQDGYGTGYWRTVAPTAAEWQGGGADPDAFSAGISPNVYDVFVPNGDNQKNILSSFNVQSKKYTVIPYLPLEPIKPIPKLTGMIRVPDLKELKPGSNVDVKVIISNIGAGLQKDDPNTNEFEMSVPDFVSIVSASANSGKVNSTGRQITWNGSIEKGKNVTLNLNLKIAEDVENGTVIPLKGVINFDSTGDGKDNAKTSIENQLIVKYPVKITVKAGSATYTKNGRELKLDSENGNTAIYDEKYGCLFVPAQNIARSLFGNYTFDKSAHKITIVFMGNKFEYWVGQNKALLDSNAVPLFPNNSEIKGFMKGDTPMIPLRSLAYAFGLKYTFNNDTKTATITYTP
jgi:alpha-amylase/alpha-mannosidase (GH57 family)